MVSMDMIADKITEIKAEMKEAGLWKIKLPGWVHEYAERKIHTEQDFAEWLQFVYLPNLMQLETRSSINTKKYIVPQAMRFFGEDVQKGKLLQLLIELDSLL